MSHSLWYLPYMRCYLVYRYQYQYFSIVLPPANNDHVNQFGYNYDVVGNLAVKRLILFLMKTQKLRYFDKQEVFQIEFSLDVEIILDAILQLILKGCQAELY